MKNKLIVAAVVLVGATALAGALVLAQTGRQSSAAPVLTELEVAQVQVAALARQLAQCEAGKLASVVQSNQVNADVTAKIEKAHPGFTIDWSTGQLAPIPKGAPTQ